VHKTKNSYPKPITSKLSEESIQILYNIQGLLGCKNLDEKISQLGEDIRAIMPRKYEFDFDFKKTISEVFEDLVKSHKKLDNVSNAKNNDWMQRLVLKVWEVDPAVFEFHNFACTIGFDGTIIDFMANAVINSFVERNWSVKYYWNQELEEVIPILIDNRGIEHVS
jgi:hypothetical protein